MPRRWPTHKRGTSCHRDHLKQCIGIERRRVCPSKPPSQCREHARWSCRSFIACLAHTRQFVAEPLDCSQIKFSDLTGEDIQREQPQERKTNQNNLRISKG